MPNFNSRENSFLGINSVIYLDACMKIKLKQHFQDNRLYLFLWKDCEIYFLIIGV